MTVESKKLSADQRKALADMLKPHSDARSRAQEKRRAAWNELEESLVKAKAEELGVPELVKKKANLSTRNQEYTSELDSLRSAIVETRDKAHAECRYEVEEIERAIKELGFQVDNDGDVSLLWDAHSLEREISEQIEKKIESSADVERKYDQAQTKVLNAETTEEAAKIVESLL